jgi:hypothetical protein
VIAHIVIAHIGGVPVEETLPSLVGAGTGLLMALTWAVSRARRLQRVYPDRLRDDDRPAA